MGKFCINCGAELKDKAAFCGNCGSAVANQSHSSGSLTGNSMPGLVGFSGHINDPEVIKKIEDGNKKGRGCIFLVESQSCWRYLKVRPAVTSLRR
jgi:phosphoheptose isomerase